MDKQPEKHMKLPVFNNRPNEETRTSDDRTIWLSRACAVVAHVMLYDTNSKQWYVLLGQRGTGTPDFQGYWGLPCGYLDWDETLSQGMVREVWEECGLHLPSLRDSEQFGWSQNSCINDTENYHETPWAIADTPRGEKQNVSMHYGIFFSWQGPTLPQLSDAYAEPNEVSGIEWVPIDKALNMELAFNHAKRIKECFETQQALFSQVVSHS